MFARTIDVVGANGYIGRGFVDFFEEWSNNTTSNACVYFADPAFINENEYQIYNSAIKRFEKAIECCDDLFIYISSSKVYLNKSKGNYSELDKKSDYYLYQKLKSRNEEKLISSFNKKYLILRIPSFVNKNPKPNTLFNKIVKSNESGKLYLKDDYSFNHEFLFYKDLFNIINIMLFDKKLNSQIFNISPSTCINIMDLLNPKFRYSSCPQPFTSLDNSKLLSYIKFNFHIPKYSIEDNSIYWFQS